MRYLLKKLSEPKKQLRIAHERFPEPIHLNLLSLLAAAFASYRMKIELDLVIRQQHAFALLKAADEAKAQGLKGVTAIEFGVASGAGLINICEISRRVSRITGVDFRIVGFDTGEGMPAPRDYRDQPDAFAQGDYPMLDRSALLKALPPNATIIFGAIEENVAAFLETVEDTSPMGFVSIDVDFYHSAKQSLRVFDGRPQQYLPLTIVYFDDISQPTANPWVGELLAVEEFNRDQAMRKLHPYTFLRSRRIFKHASWIDHIYALHVLDHPRRCDVSRRPAESAKLDNPYLVSRREPQGNRT